ncbi:endonuclease/exonuclease/phosphatase family protein [Cryobacterium luteum]|uniref:Endonuclease/exonuclease/phosphatase family protein n=1 Tax=Cryobacterium luteum TaxID=1424661 RepID=A0A1H8HCT7_9MICO|nr:endonuclease/exonuclease/phosphatase family protein [Cryobacterium luteum]TFB86723.1 endonuclease/exonuclease/phosphatase family protein [Cryobacterium luteum]SEN53358.1 Metal-dependent hydrolase, endonuclease/exonuclease/phosphatase family [Cryobacterium luteum]
MTDSALIGPVTAPDLHVMSFNIRRRLPHLNPRSPDRWVHRRSLLKRLLAAEQPALLGVQEALFDQANFVRHALGDRYRSIGHGRETNTGGEGCPIVYDSRRVRLLDWEQTALSDTPLRPGSTSWGNRTPRVVVDALFHDVATGIDFRAVNTHLDNRSRTSRVRSADVLLRIVAASLLPTVVTGDFNTDATTSPYDRLTGQGLLLDTWDTAQERLTEGWGTFLDYRPPRENHKRIDWILVTPRVTVLKAAINVTRYEGGWPSDHAAIQTVVSLGAPPPHL